MLLENAAVLATTELPSHAYPMAHEHSNARGHSPKQLPCLLPSLHRAWPYAPAAQQLTWLWQIAQLWVPFMAERVAATLLKEHLIRVEGPIVRVAELRFRLGMTSGTALTEDRTALPASPTLAHLGAFWANLMPEAAVEIQAFGRSLCQFMQEGQLNDPVVLQSVLSEGVQQLRQGQILHIQTATQTDKGPSRASNEDACFPPEGSVTTFHSGKAAQQDGRLVVVCDGIGGHQGGDVASALAIETITRRIQGADRSGLSIQTIQSDVKTAIAQANDVISQANDDKQRRERQRMGTTVVMSLLHEHICYVAHVGDSRAYWVTQWGFHQISLDDDVVSRETRLGYGTYHSLLYQPNSGALVQALGMSSSKNLYPTVQPLILQEDGILLLCSDGLSDQDLIESCWESVLLPLLKDQKRQDLGAVSQQLIDLANNYNGHDNVTVGVIRWQVSQKTSVPLAAITDLSEFESAIGRDRTRTEREPVTTLVSPANFRSSTSISSLAAVDNKHSGSGTPVPTSVAPGDSGSPEAAVPTIGLDGLEPADNQSPLGAKNSHSTKALHNASVMMGAIAILVMVGLLAYVWVPAISERVNSWLRLAPSSVTAPESSEDLNTDVVLPGPSESTEVDLAPLVVGSIVQLGASGMEASSSKTINAEDAQSSATTDLQPLSLLALNEASNGSLEEQAQIIGVVPWGSILLVKRSLQISTQETAEAESVSNALSGQNPNVVSSESDLRQGDSEQLTRSFLEVQLCAVPTVGEEPASSPSLPLGAVGWVFESDLRLVMQRQIEPSADSGEICTFSLDEPSE